MHGETWLRDAIVYAIDLASFADSDGDGWGDFGGAVDRLDHIVDLGATCIWVQPFYRSPRRDDGYDVADHSAVDPLFGTEADLRRLVDAAHDRGLHILFDLVGNHTSIDHPWFQSARRGGPHRDWYVWRDAPDASVDVEAIFPGSSDAVWHHDDEADAWYLARFYAHEPDLATGRADVLEEITRIMRRWSDVGADGFRVDAAPYIVEKAAWADPTDDGFWALERLHDGTRRCGPDIVLVGEADVKPEQYDEMLGERRCDGLFDFFVNNHLFLALATGDADPLRRVIDCRQSPPGGHLLRWVRNHDELDLERLSASERDAVYDAFAPEPDMRIYGRGIRRRYPPMVDGDRRRIELAHNIVFSLPGVPVVRYGEEIGMGDDLRQPERMAVRTAMQWTSEPSLGFSTAPPEQCSRPLITDGPFSNRFVNVADQVDDPSSLLSWFRRLLAVRRSLPVFCSAWPDVVDLPRPVLGLRYDTAAVDLLVLHNLGPDTCRVRLPERDGDSDGWREVFGSVPREPDGVVLPAFGSVWLSG